MLTCTSIGSGPVFSRFADRPVWFRPFGPIWQDNLPDYFFIPSYPWLSFWEWGFPSPAGIMLDMLGKELALHGLILEAIHLQGKDIGYCVGCALCLNKGKCWQNDDHKKITGKLFAADAVILASPVYFRSVTG
jgi:hypothetical protein